MIFTSAPDGLVSAKRLTLPPSSSVPNAVSVADGAAVLSARATSGSAKSSARVQAIVFMASGILRVTHIKEHASASIPVIAPPRWAEKRRWVSCYGDERHFVSALITTPNL